MNGSGGQSRYGARAKHCPSSFPATVCRLEGYGPSEASQQLFFQFNFFLALVLLFGCFSAPLSVCRAPMLFADASSIKLTSIVCTRAVLMQRRPIRMAPAQHVSWYPWHQMAKQPRKYAKNHVSSIAIVCRWASSRMSNLKSKSASPTMPNLNLKFGQGILCALARRKNQAEIWRIPVNQNRQGKLRPIQAPQNGNAKLG